MNKHIELCISEGRVILFLGAGASLGSKNQNKCDPPLAGELAQKIAAKAGWDFQGEALSTVYSAAKSVLGSELDDLLVKEYKQCRPSLDYISIAKFPWARIYTTNVDDALERALEQNSTQKINIKNRSDRIEDKDQVFARMEYVYLNGSIKRPEQGFVFSPEEYGKASSESPQWYEEVASDFLQCSFIFIGTNVDESVLYHQIERYKEKTGGCAPKSYVITPSATPIQIASFSSYGLEHISATLSEFCSWLNKKFPDVPSYLQVAKNKYPELRRVLEGASDESEKTANLLKNVVLVSRTSLSVRRQKNDSGTIRRFYKGFKPTWEDVLDFVPAKLEQFSKFIDLIKAHDSSKCRLYAVVGPAGSGKSTLLKMAALELSEGESKVYYVPSEVENLNGILKELDAANSSEYFLFVERLDPVKDELAKYLSNDGNCIIVAAEGKNVWHNRVASKISPFIVRKFEIEEISSNDSGPILEKLKLHGPWTRLGKLSERERKREIFERSKRQLLIGLMEATIGVGFEQIIQKEFESIASREDRLFFVLVCVATMHRCALPRSLAARALNVAGVKENPPFLAARLMGIVVERDGSYMVRHPVYARKIMESVVDGELISTGVSSLLSGFRVYRHPVVKSLNKNDADLFKAIINHRFLVDVLRSDEDRISKIYEVHEKFFEEDGLFWLQYGLFKRDFNRNIDAFEILQTAYNAYPHDHTTHALAQQKLIISSSGVLTTEQSRSHLSEAIALLEKLDDTLESDDTYPIVTLAEGHVRTLLELDGVSVARVKAKEYVDRIGRRLKKNEDQRLNDSKVRLMRFATTGVWPENSNGQFE